LGTNGFLGDAAKDVPWNCVHPERLYRKQSEPERGMNPRIVGTAGPLTGMALALTDDEISVGRDPSNKLAAADAAMSRRHCAIVKQEDG
jgi:hypothetical protein